MVSKFVAVLLIALASSPVTAPFSTCDVAALIGNGPDRHQVAPFPTTHEKLVSSAAGSLLPTLSTVRSRTRVLTNVILRLSVRPTLAIAAGYVPSGADRVTPRAPRVTNLRV